MASNEPVNVVAGLGRCGTSLVMQMLDAAGLPVVVGEGPPAYEDNMQLGLVRDSRAHRTACTWLAGLGGKFVKLLDPQRMKLPHDVRYNVLWLDRDYQEQARSQAKFLERVEGIDKLSESHIRALQRQLPKDRLAAGRVWRRLGEVPTILTFERLVLGGDAIDDLAEWAGVPERADVMRKVIVPRGPACLPVMLEAFLLRERPSGARL